MLKSVAVSRHGPRSMATTSRPASVSSWARMAPVQPRPTMTTSLRGSLRAIVLSLVRPFRAAGDGHRAVRIRLIVFGDVVAVVVTRARKADHLPRHHVVIAAIDRVGKEAFHGVLQDQTKQALAIDGAEIDLAGLHRLEEIVLLLSAKFGEAFVLALAQVSINCGKTGAVARRRRRFALIALRRQTFHERTGSLPG